MRATAEAKLIRRAVRERWPVTPAAQEDAVKVTKAIMLDDEEGARARIAAVKALIDMQAQNQTDDWAEDKNKRLDDGKATERIDGVELKIAGMEAKD